MNLKKKHIDLLYQNLPSSLFQERARLTGLSQKSKWRWRWLYWRRSPRAWAAESTSRLWRASWRVGMRAGRIKPRSCSRRFWGCDRSCSSPERRPAQGAAMRQQVQGSIQMLYLSSGTHTTPVKYSCPASKSMIRKTHFKFYINIIQIILKNLHLWSWNHQMFFFFFFF